MVVLAAGAARAHHQDSVGTEHLLVGILQADGPGAATLISWGVTTPALESKLDALSAPAGSTPAAGHIPFTPKTKKVIEGRLRHTALLGHEQIGTDHLLSPSAVDARRPRNPAAHLRLPARRRSGLQRPTTAPRTRHVRRRGIRDLPRSSLRGPRRIRRRARPVQPTRLLFAVEQERRQRRGARSELLTTTCPSCGRCRPSHPHHAVSTID
ncbi:Clp protease N-terminal domain-containing protein [Rhodococcus sp. NPDC057014]|uniref:Clp protease N-terminal domain-containing protein n=1 Tax=Rhodococcus sp. NPDC057014 TaxID=3346000 RepID=UPI0036377869